MPSLASLTKSFWIALGFVFTGIGIIGMVTPLMPGLVFLLIATFCFAKGSRKFLKMLLSNKYIGPVISDYRKGEGMTVQTKLSAITVLLLGSIISILVMVKNRVGKYAIGVTAIIVTLIILKQKNKNINYYYFILVIKINLIITILLGLCLASCSSDDAVLKNLHRFNGYWVVDNNTYKTVEFWETVSSEGLSGGSFNVIAGDTNITELLKIVHENGVLFYIPTVFGQNEDKPIKFRLTAYTDSSYVFENSLHDFPKKISYTFSGDTVMTVMAEGNAKKPLLFRFKRYNKN